MQNDSYSYINGLWQKKQQSELEKKSYDLKDGIALVFSDRELIEDKAFIEATQKQFANNNDILYCSTAGEIDGLTVSTLSAVCINFSFEKTPHEFAFGNIQDHANSFDLGVATAKKMNLTGLKYVMLIADGNKINGDDLLSGIQSVIPEKVIISGGMAGDGVHFKKTLVGLNKDIKEGNVVLLGLYGDHIKVGNGFEGGWDMYGPERTITKSEGNILYEIDGESALGLYKKYLGKYADELPSSALFFPISIQSKDGEGYIVRTILSVDEANQSMTFAGNMPEGAEMRFMKSNPDRLIHAAADAGYRSVQSLEADKAEVAIIVSCIGRRLVLSDRTEEEVEAAIDHFPEGISVAGFFSYGEIAPDRNKRRSQLHNQTFSVTTFTERL